MIITIILRIAGILLIISSVCFFIQSFRKKDINQALLEDGVFEDPNKISRSLRIYSIISFIIGIIFISI